MSLAKLFDDGIQRRSLWAASRLLVGPMCAILCACGGEAGEGGSDTASVYASLDSIQCAGVQNPLSSLSSRLAASGVEVVSSSCGVDGAAHAAVCGAPDGRIGIFSIPASQASTARSLGFAPLGDLPGAAVAACPAGGS